MRLKDWRNLMQWSLAKAAEEFGITTKNPGETVRRWEEGMNRPDADDIHRIALVTKGAVTAQDMHETRLAFLQGEAGADAA